MACGTSTRTVLIGWDSANWDVLTPLLDAGQLPNLGRLIARGVMGRMITRGPILAPIVFNSVATGKYADKHGVLGPNEVAPDKTIRPVTGLSRRTKAFWEIASQNGRQCHVVNFPATGPAELGTINADGSGFEVEIAEDRKMSFGERATFRLLLKGQLLEVYLGDFLIECFSLPRAATGRIGLIGVDAASLERVKAWSPR